MIFFKPLPGDGADSTAVFEALDGEECLGKCFLKLDGMTADVFYLDLSGGAEIGEGLLRAAYNFAANKGAYWGVCSAKNAEEATKRLRFEVQNGVLQNDIPTLLTGTCGGQ